MAALAAVSNQTPTAAPAYIVAAPLSSTNPVSSVAAAAIASANPPPPSYDESLQESHRPPAFHHSAAVNPLEHARAVSKSSAAAISPVAVSPSREENDRNLLLIGQQIHAALVEIRVTAVMPTTADQVRDLFRVHRAAINTIENLSFFNLRLTVIPEEFLALELSRLRVLFLTGTQLTSLPANFLSNAVCLETLHLEGNAQLTFLPVNFLSNARYLQRLYLENNAQLTFLPANFLSNADRLIILYLASNRFTSLPTNFLSNARGLQRLHLAYNELASLPVGFGNAWSWWSGKRNEVLYGNPILLNS